MPESAEGENKRVANGRPGQRRSQHGGEACEKVAKTAELGYDPAEKGLAVLNRAEAGDPTAWAASLST